MRRTLYFNLAMLAFACTLVLSAGREARAQATGASFRAGTEFFVLSKSKKENGTWMFFVTPADDPTSGYWLPVRPAERRFAFLAADEDLLAYDVASPSRAHYLKAKSPVENARKDEKKFAKLTSQEPHWRERFFSRMEDNIPKTGTQVLDKTEDSQKACPAHPQGKNGKPCEELTAKTLPEKLQKMIKRSAAKNHLPPALLAAIIQNESGFDFWLENTVARDACKNEGKCSKYKWERGLGQLGFEVSKSAGIDWDVSIGKVGRCAGKGTLTDDCVGDLERACEEYRIRNPKKLSPYDCPAAAVEAAARKLRSTREQQANKTIHPPDLAKALQPEGGGLEAWRNLVGAYNRGPRVANAYAEYHRQTGHYPVTYGAAWIVQRKEGETPSSKGLGYSLLHKEYINRCYVYRVVGICGGLPEQSLVKQFEKQLPSDSLEGPAPKRDAVRRALARE